MAKPVDFEESDTKFVLKGCGDLPAYVDHEDNTIVTCWQLSGDEMMEVLQTGKVWLVVQGNQQPPVEVTGTHPFYFGGQETKDKTPGP